KVVGDNENATQVQTGGGGVARYPIWLSLRGKEAFNSKSLPTAQLNSAMFIESGDIASMMLQFAQPDDVAKQITPSGKKTIAALVTGKFKTAFPDGMPKDEKP